MVVFVVLGTILAAFLLVYLFPQESARAFRIIKKSRKIVGGILGVVGSLILIATGIFPLQVLGAATFFYIGLWLAVENPHETLLDIVR